MRLIWQIPEKHKQILWEQGAKKLGFASGISLGENDS